MVFLEQAQHMGEVEQRAAQAVDFVDYHAVEFAGLDGGQQASQSRTIHVGGGEAAIVVTVGERAPAFAPLTEDEVLGGIALRVERVKVLLQSFFGRLPGVNGAADRPRLVRRFTGCHAALSSFSSDPPVRSPRRRRDRSSWCR